MQLGMSTSLSITWKHMLLRVKEGMSGLARIMMEMCKNHFYAIEDSKSLAQIGYAQRIEDVDALTVWIEEKSA